MQQFSRTELPDSPELFRRYLESRWVKNEVCWVNSWVWMNKITLPSRGTPGKLQLCITATKTSDWKSSRTSLWYVRPVSLNVQSVLYVKHFGLMNMTHGDLLCILLLKCGHKIYVSLSLTAKRWMFMCLLPKHLLNLPRDFSETSCFIDWMHI